MFHLSRNSDREKETHRRASPRRVAASRCAIFGQLTRFRAQVVPPGHHELTLTVGGLERRRLVHLPTGYDKTKAVPLIIVLHGMGGTAIHSVNETCWSAKADAQGFIAAFPEGTRPAAVKPPSLRTGPPDSPAPFDARPVSGPPR